MMEKDSKIYIAGHKGLVGSAITRQLKKEGYNNLVFKNHKDWLFIIKDDIIRIHSRP